MTQTGESGLEGFEISRVGLGRTGWGQKEFGIVTGRAQSPLPDPTRPDLTLAREV